MLVPVGGRDADAAARLTEVEEHGHAIRDPAHYPASRSSNSDLSYASDRVGPLAPVSVVASTKGSGALGVNEGAPAPPPLPAARPRPPISASSTATSSRRSSTSKPALTNSTITVWGQDVSWLMNLKEKVREWVNVTEGQVAAQIFGDYGVTPADEHGRGFARLHGRQSQPDAAWVGHRLSQDAGTAQRQGRAASPAPISRASGPATSPRRSSTAMRCQSRAQRRQQLDRQRA